MGKDGRRRVMVLLILVASIPFFLNFGPESCSYYFYRKDSDLL